MRIVSLHKQVQYNKGLFIYRILNSKAPEYKSNLNTHPPHAVLTLGTISLVCLGQQETYSKQE